MLLFTLRIAQVRFKDVEPISPRRVSMGEDPCKTGEVSSSVLRVPG
jgi:hypothetical protein